MIYFISKLSFKEVNLSSISRNRIKTMIFKNEVTFKTNNTCTFHFNSKSFKPLTYHFKPYWIFTFNGLTKHINYIIYFWTDNDPIYMLVCNICETTQGSAENKIAMKILDTCPKLSKHQILKILFSVILKILHTKSDCLIFNLNSIP